MMYLGMGGRCGEAAGELFDVCPRRRKGDRRADVSGRCVWGRLSTWLCIVCGGARQAILLHVRLRKGDRRADVSGR